MSKTTLASEVKRLRQAAKMSQPELAAKCERTQGWVSQIESGMIDIPASDVMNKLCAALGVPLDHFAKLISPDVKVPPPPSATLPSVDLSRMEPIRVIGTIGAGPAVDYPAEYNEHIYFERLFPGDIAAYHVRGDSMRDELIADGDRVIIRISPVAKAGEKVVAWLASEDGCVCKRLKGRGEKRWLEGPNGWRHELTPDDVVFGVIVGVIRRERP